MRKSELYKHIRVVLFPSGERFGSTFGIIAKQKHTTDSEAKDGLKDNGDNNSEVKDGLLNVSEGNIEKMKFPATTETDTSKIFKQGNVISS